MDGLKLIIPQSHLLPDVFNRLKGIFQEFPGSHRVYVKVTSKEGDKVSITWKDIVHVVNLDRRDCSVMETSGVVYRVYNDFILIKNPDTVRTHPLPIQSHPMDKPKFL
jgi:hypothetical protein